MTKLKKRFKRGAFNSWSMMLIAIVAVSTVAIVGILSAPPSLEWALGKVTGSGYVVFATGEYADIINRLNNISTKADQAVTNASAAVVAAQLAAIKVELHNENVVFLYPNTSTATCTLTAGVGVDTFGAWAEINASDGYTLSSYLALDGGYLEEVTTYNYSAANKKYIIEIAYGGSYTVVARIKIRADLSYPMNIMSKPIPAGQTIYYRMQSETSGATLKVDLRYYYN